MCLIRKGSGMSSRDLEEGRCDIQRIRTFRGGGLSENWVGGFPGYPEVI